MSQYDKLITDPLSKNNPITVQILGVCSALAVTSSIEKALVMALAVTFVTALSNFTISLIRDYIPGRIRMIVQLVVIAFLVTLVSIFLKVFMYELSKELALFVGLIITNCIVMGRLEAFAMANKPLPSLLDGIGNGLGYGVILVIIGAIRELFGTGKLLGFNIFGDATLKTGLYSFGYSNNGLMLLPIASIFIIGVLVWIHRSMNSDLVDIS